MLLGGIGHEGEVIFGGELQIGLLLRRFGIHNIRIFDFCIGILLQIQCKEIGRGKDGFLRQCRIIPLAEYQRGNFKQGAATGGIHFLPHIFISVQEKAKKGCMLCLHGIRLFYHLKTPLSAVFFAASIITLF